MPYIGFEKEQTANREQAECQLLGWRKKRLLKCMENRCGVKTDVGSDLNGA